MSFVTGAEGAAARGLLRGRWRLRLALGVVGLALALGVFAIRVSHAMPDFDVYWRAGVRAAAAEPLYRAEDGHYQLKYLPAFAVLAIPLGTLPRDVAAGLWFVSSILALGLLLAVSIRLLPERRMATALLVAATLVVFGKFYARELVLGQVNLFLALAVASALLLNRRRPIAAGALVALAIVLKPYAVLLLPWLAVTRQVAALAAAAAGVAVVLLAPSAIYGWSGTATLHREWLALVLESTPPNLINPDNVSWLAMYSRWFGPGPLSGMLALTTGLAVVALAGWLVARRQSVARPAGLEGALLLVAMPFLSPQGWDYVLLVATPAVVFLVNYQDRLPVPWRVMTIAALLVVGLTVYDLLGRTLYHGFMHASGITLCFFVVIAALAQLRRLRAA